MHQRASSVHAHARDNKPWLDHGLNILLALFVGILLVSPTGPLGTWLAEKRETSRLETLTAEHWNDLAEGSLRLDETAGLEPDIVIFFDYMCRFCRQAHSVIEAFMEGNPEVKVGMRFLITTTDPFGRVAASAAICSDQQGGFRQANRLLNDGEYVSRRPGPEELASELELTDKEDFVSCLERDLAGKRLNHDASLAGLLEIRATPTFVTRTSRQAGVLSEGAILDLLGSVARR